MEVRILARLVAKDIRTTTARNLLVLRRETGGLGWTSAARELRKELRKREVPVPDMDFWRLPYLGKLLEQRDILVYSGEGEDCDELARVKSLIDSVCIN